MRKKTKYFNVTQVCLCQWEKLDDVYCLEKNTASKNTAEQDNKKKKVT